MIRFNFDSALNKKRRGCISSSLFVSALFSFFCVSNVQAQFDTTYVQDTVVLYQSNGFETKQNIGNQTEGLSESLALKTPVFIKDYGAGNLATVTYQGSSASQTALFWEGINLVPSNSGTTDYSLVDSYLFDEFSLKTSQNTRQGSGIGADITLDNHIVIDEGMKASTLLSYGAFNDAKMGVKFKVSDSLNSLSIAVLGGLEENNFKYYHPINKQYEYRVNNKNQFLSSLLTYYRFTKSGCWSFKSWHRSSERQIPTPIHVENQGELMNDSYSRNVLGYATVFANGMEWETGLAFLTDNYEYNNPTSTIFGEGKTKRLNLNSNLKHQLSSKLSYQLTLFGDLQKALVSNNNIKRNLFGGAFLLDYSILEQWDINAVIRKEVYLDENSLPFSLDINSSYKIGKNQAYVRFYKNARIPTLNDLYWENGGNKELKSEYAKTVYFGLKRQSKWSYNLEFFAGNIEQMIQWTPNSENGLWQPENIGFVHREGLNLESSYRFRRFEIGGLYAYVQAEDSDGFQLIYTPKNQVKGWLKMSVLKKINVEYSGIVSGSRFVTRDHTSYLPYFMVSNVAVSKSFKLSPKFNLNSQLKVNNLFNFSYYNIPFRPMTGRYVGLQITIDYAK